MYQCMHTWRTYCSPPLHKIQLTRLLLQGDAVSWSCKYCPPPSSSLAKWLISSVNSILWIAIALIYQVNYLHSPGYCSPRSWARGLPRHVPSLPLHSPPNKSEQLSSKCLNLFNILDGSMRHQVTWKQPDTYSACLGWTIWCVVSDSYVRLLDPLCFGIREMILLGLLTHFYDAKKIEICTNYLLRMCHARLSRYDTK